MLSWLFLLGGVSVAVGLLISGNGPYKPDSRELHRTTSVALPQLPSDNLAAFLNQPQLKFIYPCLDFDGDAAVNKQAEKVLAPRFGTGLLDAEIPGFSFQ